MDGDRKQLLDQIRQEYRYKIYQWHRASQEGMPGGNGLDGLYEIYEKTAWDEAHEHGRALGLTVEEVDEALKGNPDAES